MEDDNILSLRKISFQRGSETVLRDISLDIHRGEYYVIRGRSGVGKTTLAKIVSLLIKPSSGRIFFKGIDVTDKPEHVLSDLRLKYIGYVDQYYTLLENFTVLENVLLPLKLLRKVDDEDIRYAMNLLRDSGLEGKINSYPRELSGGERQRVAIVRALVKKPTLFVGDEPYSSLDDETRDMIEKLLHRCIIDYGLTIIITTTDLYTGFKSNKEYLLVNGRLKPFK